jgi:xanthine dehydrogenase accessory factor
MLGERGAAPLVLVKGAGDIGSAVAHALWRAGLRVVIVDVPAPSVARRRMAFADALFDGEAVLDGTRAVRVEEAAALPAALSEGRAILVTAAAGAGLVVRPNVMVDARMRKRERPEPQISEAALTIGLGPGFRAGETVHVAIETNWGPDLGRVLWHGEPEAYTGEPRAILGFSRERYLYAPHAGHFHTDHEIGTAVEPGQPVAWVDETPLVAQIGGVIRGVTRDGVRVSRGAKVVDIDPRGDARGLDGIGERPRRIAEGVLAAIREWQGQRPRVE